MKCPKCKHEIPDDSKFCPDCQFRIDDKEERIKQLMKEAKQAYDAGDYGQSLIAYQEAANLGHAEAQYMLAVQYDNGQGTLKDRQTAHNWLLKAAQNGHVHAQYFVGEHYYYGECVKQDKQEAAKWYQKAANAQHPDAAFKLGLCYKNGNGVERDDNLAQQYFEKAKELGSEKYMDYLAQQREQELIKRAADIKEELNSNVPWLRGCAICSLGMILSIIVSSLCIFCFLSWFGVILCLLCIICGVSITMHIAAKMDNDESKKRIMKWKESHHDDPVCKYL